jgi:hypothetical protein
MGRERVETEVTTIEAETVTLCDECGREANGGIILLPIKRDHWDEHPKGTSLVLSHSKVGDPIFRCQDCRKDHVSIEHLPDKELPSERTLGTSQRGRTGVEMGPEHQQLKREAAAFGLGLVIGVLLIIIAL